MKQAKHRNLDEMVSAGVAVGRDPFLQRSNWALNMDGPQPFHSAVFTPILDSALDVTRTV